MSKDSKPIKAIKVTGKNWTEVYEFAKDSSDGILIESQTKKQEKYCLLITCLGLAKAKAGDYVLQSGNDFHSLSESSFEFLYNEIKA